MKAQPALFPLFSPLLYQNGAVMGYDEEEVIIRSYEPEKDRTRVEFLERSCELGPNQKVFLFTDTLGDPICRIKNSPLYIMLVAEIRDELVGVIQGSIKLVTLHNTSSSSSCSWNLSKVGYILGLRVEPRHRRKHIGLKLVEKLEEWFVSNDVDYSYMATEKDNKASVKLFIEKLGYLKFRTPTILVNPVNHNQRLKISSNVAIRKLKVEEAETVYRGFMGSTEFFPDDIDRILKNKSSLGTFVAYYKDGENIIGNKNWAILSVWNSGELFKLRVGKSAPLPCLFYTKSWKWIGKNLSCFGFAGLPDFFDPFGFYFIYGVHQEGPSSGKLVRELCRYVHNLATMNPDCKIVVTEVAENDALRQNIPHWKNLSCPEDLWCIKAMKKKETVDLEEMTKMATKKVSRALFVDPREV